MDDYIAEFENLTAQIPRLPGYFLHGSKEEIRGKVRSLAVMGDLNRSKMLHMAKVVERETKGDSGMSYQRQAKSGHVSTRGGIHGSNRGSSTD